MYHPGMVYQIAYSTVVFESVVRNEWADVVEIGAARIILTRHRHETEHTAIL